MSVSSQSANLISDIKFESLGENDMPSIFNSASDTIIKWKSTLEKKAADNSKVRYMSYVGYSSI